MTSPLPSAAINLIDEILNVSSKTPMEKVAALCVLITRILAHETKIKEGSSDDVAIDAICERMKIAVKERRALQPCETQPTTSQQPSGASPQSKSDSPSTGSLT